MAQTSAPKSILKQVGKKSNDSTITDELQEKAAQARRNLGIALYHANRIQDQKNATAQILSRIEILSELPTRPSPTSREAGEFTELVRIFQPSDFDGLIEERLANGRCGYTLCGKSPRSLKLGSSAVWKLGSKVAGDYCSNQCLKKALYVRTQLSEIPAWEREPGQNPSLILHSSDNFDTNSNIITRNQSRDNGRGELAFERGETVQSVKPHQVMTQDVVEKMVVGINHQAASESAAFHNTIEGYEPRHIQKSKRQPTDDETSGDESLLDESKEPQAHEPSEGMDAESQDAWQDLYQNLGR